MSAPENPFAFACADGVDYQSGMSLRDYFAAHALAGLTVNPPQEASLTDTARDAFAYADAMLGARHG